MSNHLLLVAQGQEPADLVIKNGQIVNVNSGEIYPGGVAVAGDKIAAIGDVEYTIGPSTQVVDAQGQYITPGFLDGHIHPESANLNITHFAEIALSHGTTGIFTDLHEIGVVGGQAAIDAVLEEGLTTPLKLFWVVPSHIPFSPGLETSGGSFNAEIIEKALAREDAVGLSEVVSIYVAQQHPDLLKSIAATQKERKVVSGHGPDAKGALWNEFVAAGVTNDHEALSADEILLRIRNGVNAQLRHNLIVPTLPELIKAITEHKVDTRLASLVTDDTTAVTLVNQGHLDYLVAMAIQLGVDFITAIQMVTLNTAQTFHKDFEVGSLAPGRYADINIISGPEQITILKTFANGKLIAENNKPVIQFANPKYKPVLLNTFHLKAPVTAQDLLISAPAGAKTARVRGMRTLPWIPVTNGIEADLPVKNGLIAADLEQDVLNIAVVERHHATGNIGKAFIAGLNLKRGALASSIGHDNHNIVVVGSNPEDMAVAVNRVAELQGGILLVEDENVIDEIELPVAGLLSDLDAWSLAARRQKLLDEVKERGTAVSDVFMFFSFFTLAALPEFAVTDKGYIEVAQQKIIDAVLSFA